MSIQEIRESGLLELYALDSCSPEEISQVEKAIEDYPELLDDIKEISKALEVYAYSHRVTPSADLKDKIMNQVSSTSSSITTPDSIVQTTSAGSNMFRWASGLLGLTSIILGGLYLTKSNEMDMLIEQRTEDAIKCDSLLQESEMNYAILQDLQNSNNRILPFTATEKYEDVALTFIYNDDAGKNYIQVQNLPVIASNKSYQLWSLKADQDPIPLTVFQGNEGVFIPVDYESGTATYAITVEPYGGQDSPTLSNLVATVGV